LAYNGLPDSTLDSRKLEMQWDILNYRDFEDILALWDFSSYSTVVYCLKIYYEYLSKSVPEGAKSVMPRCLQRG
jgi:hypothetical protein